MDKRIQDGTSELLGITDVTYGLGDLQSCVVVRDIMTRVGDKWSVLVVVMLGKQTLRFSELRRIIPDVSQRMLSLTLRQLERDGIVSRAVTPSVPPRVDYALTPLGSTLLATLEHLSNWANEHKVEVLQAREAFDRREATEE